MPRGWRSGRKDHARRCHVFAAGRVFVDGNMYPDPAILTLVGETDTADGLRNTGEIA